ncbi:MAG: Gfo/Idh/MocA family oxidoreductase [Dysgonamonadaceae bacterium]|jgi:predicted dehydrogenase|nr:Gfo/Idh/MocA family oxidoreductase [Dysgonamonadaceae bacterium]
MTTRRNFIKNTAAGAALLSLGNVLPSFSAKTYRNIVGANERINVGSIGVNSRGLALAQNFAKIKECRVSAICDVDSRAIAKCSEAVKKITGEMPTGEKDLRRLLEKKDLDAVIIAMPDHWHAPAALLALKAGKHVYLEKPCGHSPSEGEILIQAATKYSKLIQMGNQRRSWPNISEAIRKIHEGVIGDVYFGRCWYTNNRKPIGIGEKTAVPDWLDWDLWQGPAPRESFRDNIVHYNWHWFWNWGTGEALNNGTHMVDLLRWGMNLDYPSQVFSVGGRYYYQDDWETPDTQNISLNFGNKKSIVWEGQSCNAYKIEGQSAGLLFYGSKGSMLIGGGNAYQIFDQGNQLIEDVKSQIEIDTRNLMNPAEQLDGLHIQNFFDGIKKNIPLNSDITSGHISTLLVQLGNISQRTGHTLEINPANGHILNDKQANKLWSREYQKGWEMKL